ncbi:hypothetical protein PRIPAC_88687 [Pristionchus pacificus]|uniref:Galectin domain-containing protein n=1 Tax=Pristionchus pacificus TaxID=54126 RepID=A0A2A6CV90_PRIPA|nr:hypothetical protein PRIPAC_88687 [Pristionchus pacificus]|eukprot:PDM82079.1 hypothetical protein PRIPAC_36472 [Pristionchus pacificus]
MISSPFPVVTVSVVLFGGSDNKIVIALLANGCVKTPKTSRSSAMFSLIELHSLRLIATLSSIPTMGSILFRQLPTSLVSVPQCSQARNLWEMRRRLYGANYSLKQEKSHKMPFRLRFPKPVEVGQTIIIKGTVPAPLPQ